MVSVVPIKRASIGSRNLGNTIESLSDRARERIYTEAPLMHNHKINTSDDIHSLEYHSAGIGSKNDLLLRGWAGLGVSGSFKRSKRSSIHACGAWSKLNCTQTA